MEHSAGRVPCHGFAAALHSGHERIHSSGSGSLIPPAGTGSGCSSRLEGNSGCQSRLPDRGPGGVGNPWRQQRGRRAPRCHQRHSGCHQPAGPGVQTAHSGATENVRHSQGQDVRKQRQADLLPGQEFGQLGRSKRFQHERSGEEWNVQLPRSGTAQRSGRCGEADHADPLSGSREGCALRYLGGTALPGNPPLPAHSSAFSQLVNELKQSWGSLCNRHEPGCAYRSTVGCWPSSMSGKRPHP